ncbi:HAD family hydrolase [Gordonia sp. DT30]|uniref:HAD family hydrolase n=1 Tax=unclassified Gordonia (in: high G+C Gram-positive bacteria) TaxID=2657482 RepID=UPI003CE81A71
MSDLIATDLDRTLIFSRTAMGEQQFAALDPVCVEIYQDAPLSYLTPRAHTLLSRLAAVAPVVPVTTRTPAQFARITLPGSPFRYAIVSSGGRILCAGGDDPQWRAEVERRVRTCAPLAEVTSALHTRIDDSWVRSSRTADDLFCYVVVDLDRQPAAFLDDWRGWCAARGWTVSQQGRKIYALPREVTKSAALAHVRARLIDEGALDADAPVYAAGDGRLDIDLLEYADAAIRPCHGELHGIDWMCPDLTVTTEPGAIAGEQILEWFLARVGADAKIGS